jgi:hypothetical protein
MASEGGSALAPDTNSTRSPRARTKSPLKNFGYEKFGTGDWAPKLTDRPQTSAILRWRRPMFTPLRAGSSGVFLKRGKWPTETALAGWGARIRTWEWRNQNPTISPLNSTLILQTDAISYSLPISSLAKYTECWRSQIRQPARGERRPVPRSVVDAIGQQAGTAPSTIGSSELPTTTRTARATAGQTFL